MSTTQNAWKDAVDDEFERYNDVVYDFQSDRKRTVKPQKDKQIQQYINLIMQNGYVIIPNLIDDNKKLDFMQSEMKRLHSALSTPLGRNAFSGRKTIREYNILNETRAFDDIITNKYLNGIVDGLFQYPNGRISNISTITILPGERKQAWHCDNHFSNMYPPRISPLKCIMQISTIFAIDSFTNMNGATLMIPQSHLWNINHIPTVNDKNNSIKITMPRGSIAIWLGTTWHSGGNNTSSKSRSGLQLSFRQPWLRSGQNMILAMSTHTVKKLHPIIQSRIGYSLHYPFYGHVAQKHPLKQLMKNKLPIQHKL